jgi:hypothetical protein
MRWAICSWVFVCACNLAPTTQVGQGQTLMLDDTNGVNGDVSCDGGTINMPTEGWINGTLDANDCVLKISGTINGSLTATGGVVHVIDATSVNGQLTVTSAFEVVIAGTGFNGGADVESSVTVTVTDTDFNGDGEFTGDTVSVTDAEFNGSLTVSGSKACSESGNSLNGSLSASGCGG